MVSVVNIHLYVYHSSVYTSDKTALDVSKYQLLIGMCVCWFVFCLLYWNLCRFHLVWFVKIHVTFNSLRERVLASKVSGCLLDSLVHEKYMILGKKTH